MKTFKLVSLKISHPQNQVIIQEVHLIDGLVINKEDDQRQWLIEMYVDKSHSELFNKLKDDEQELLVEAVISRSDNAPAPFITTILSVSLMEDNMSVLLNGLIVGKLDRSEDVLTELIEEGFHGNALLEEFKKRNTNEKPQTKISVK
ncbi:YwpF family protein [Bacillus suaedaesalsae]|uniref:YwpF-like protein n=1 Tax=Bacillus suaedaesalsae TaxID=2810349 RepID=A0ABS2DL17_9BACI|nr:YwpF family protein [Bacillus suaedaesalsae]MBM6619180.1 hypothetical protein [Bacillus suaedaesalsae]